MILLVTAIGILVYLEKAPLLSLLIFTVIASFAYYLFFEKRERDKKLKGSIKTANLTKKNNTNEMNGDFHD